MTLLGARFPGRYLQGPDILSLLGKQAAIFGKSAICVVDRGVHDLLAPALEAACAGAIEATLIRHGGECWSRGECASSSG